jgi:peptidoglycan/LPS O-acetylase OafA/YrhL
VTVGSMEKRASRVSEKILAPQHVHVRLDVVRGVAALLVFAAHITQIFFWRLWGAQATAAVVAGTVARHSVLVFFLLSGNLITQSIRSNIRRHGRFDIADYAVSRVARIYPPLLGSISICVVALAIIYTLKLPGWSPYGLVGDVYRARVDFSFSAKEILTVLAMKGGLLTPNGALWSLFIEFRIYLVAMAVAAWWQRDWLARIWTLLVGVVAALFLHDSSLYVAIWLMGAATAFMRPRQRAAFAVAGIAVLIVGASIVWRRELLGAGTDSLPGQVLQIVCCLAYCAVLFFFHPNWRYPKPLIATGNFSYSLYIIHFPLLLLLLSLSQNFIGHSAARTALVAVIGALTILGVAIPFAALLERPAYFKSLIFKAVALVPSRIRLPHDQECPQAAKRP